MSEQTADEVKMLINSAVGANDASVKFQRDVKQMLDVVAVGVDQRPTIKVNNDFIYGPPYYFMFGLLYRVDMDIARQVAGKHSCRFDKSPTFDVILTKTVQTLEDAAALTAEVGWDVIKLGLEPINQLVKRPTRPELIVTFTRATMPTAGTHVVAYVLNK